MIPLLLVLSMAEAADRADTLAEQAQQAYTARDSKRAQKLAERSVAIRENESALSVLLLTALERLQDPPSAKARRSEEAAKAERVERVAALEAAYTRLERVEPKAVALGIVRTILNVASEGDLLPVLEPACSADARASFDAAEAAFGAGNNEKALALYDAALALCPTNSVWWTWSGDAFHVAGNTTGALARYEHALEIDPCNNVAHRFAADTMLAIPSPTQTETTKLVGHALDSVVCNPRYEAGWSTLGGLAEGIGRNDVRMVDPEGYQLLLQRATPGEGDALDRRVALVTTILAEGPPDSPIWRLFALAKEANLLTEAVAFETLDAEIAEAYRARRLAMQDGLRTWLVATRVAPK